MLGLVFCGILWILCFVRFLHCQEKATGRRPIDAEETLGFSVGINPLLEDLESKGELINWDI